MPSNKKEINEALRMGIKTLILHEVRLLRLERAFTPSFIIEAESHSIEETKKKIVRLTQGMGERERAVLLRRMIRNVIDEEIDRAIQLRKTQCIRCIHGRFYDEFETPYVNLPIGINRILTIGCDELQAGVRKTCRRFVEKARATSLEEYLGEMALLYEVRDVLDRIKEIWRDYLSK
jgi:hypothetical protein